MMKILITESQKEKILYDFMKSFIDDNLEENKPSYVDTYIVYWNKVDDYSYENPVLIEYDNTDGRLYINKKYINDLKSWMPLDDKEVFKLIKNSFEKKFDVKIKYIKSN